MYTQSKENMGWRMAATFKDQCYHTHAPQLQQFVRKRRTVRTKISISFSEKDLLYRLLLHIFRWIGDTSHHTLILSTNGASVLYVTNTIIVQFGKVRFGLRLKHIRIQNSSQM